VELSGTFRWLVLEGVSVVGFVWRNGWVLIEMLTNCGCTYLER
jgi:hypothetical protein